jgi:tRNA 2-thiouridine synthesizing protein A
MNDILNFDKDLDACGLSCPLPILRARRALGEMNSGEILRVRATDNGTKNDFASFAKQTGNEVVGQGEEEGGVFWFLIKRR